MTLISCGSAIKR